MVVSLFMSVMMLMLVHDLKGRDICLTPCRRLRDICGCDEGEILPQIAEQKCPVFVWEPGGDGWQDWEEEK